MSDPLGETYGNMNSEKPYGHLDCFFFVTNASKIRVFASFYQSKTEAETMFRYAQCAFGELVEMVQSPAPTLTFVNSPDGRKTLTLTPAQSRAT